MNLTVPTKDRDLGFLTKGDVEFLYSDEEIDPSDNTQYQKRYRLVNRIRSALVDFSALLTYLPARDRGRVFRSRDDIEKDIPIYRGIEDMIAFAYMAGQDAGYDIEEVFESAIENAMSGYHSELAEIEVSVEVEVDDSHSVEAIRERFDDPAERLSMRDAGILIKKGNWTNEERERMGPLFDELEQKIHLGSSYPWTSFDHHPTEYSLMDIQHSDFVLDDGDPVETVLYAPGMGNEIPPPRRSLPDDDKVEIRQHRGGEALRQADFDAENKDANTDETNDK